MSELYELGLVPNVLVGNAYRSVRYDNTRDGGFDIRYAFPLGRVGTRVTKDKLNRADIQIKKMVEENLKDYDFKTFP